jgi:hypothetical protein
MLKPKTHSASKMKHHQCDATRKGDWIIYRCPKCDYELRENWRTGDMKVSNPTPKIKHSGSYFPIEYQDVYGNLN